MANNANKKIIVKKDMNFFAEFTASAAKAARLLTYAILFGAAVVGVILIFIVIGIVRNTIIKGQITDLENQLASDEYANLEVQASALPGPPPLQASSPQVSSQRASVLS